MSCATSPRKLTSDSAHELVFSGLSRPTLDKPFWLDAGSKSLPDSMACLLQNDALLITASGDRTVCAWDTSTGDAVAYLAGHSGSVKSCKFWEASPTVVATGNRDGCVRARPFAVPLPAPIHQYTAVRCRKLALAWDQPSGVQRRPACRSRCGVSLIMQIPRGTHLSSARDESRPACAESGAWPGLQVFDLRSESVSMPGHWNHSHLPVLSIVVSAASAHTLSQPQSSIRGQGWVRSRWDLLDLRDRSDGSPFHRTSLRECLLDED